MAIVFEQKRKINWFRLIIFVLILGTIFAATYYLFFAPSPKIELIIPSPLETVGEVSQIEFIDPSTITQSTAFSILRPYGSPPTPGSLGRPNPFLPF